MVRDMDLVRPDVHDTRCLEVVVDGLSVEWTPRWAVPFMPNGEGRRNAARRDGVAKQLAGGRSALIRTARGGRAKLVVLGVEVGGRWSSETRSFLSKLAHDRARSERFLMRRRVEQAWRLRWGSLLSCAAARAVAMYLLERALCHTSFRHAGLDVG